MKEKNENKLDQLFKDGLSGSEDHIAFREEDWTAMEQLLDKKPRIFRSIYFISGIAALLLIAIGLFFFVNDDRSNPKQKKLYSVNKTTKSNNNQNNEPPKHSGSALPSGTENLGNNSAGSNVNKSFLPLPADRKNINNQNQDSRNKDIIAPVTGKTSQDTSIVNNSNNLANNNTAPTSNQVPNKVLQNNQPSATSTEAQNNVVQNTLASTNQPDTATTVTTPVQQVKKDKASIKYLGRNRPRFTLSILAAPDINAVNSFSRNQVGTNLGFQLAIHLSKKLSISTGAAYAVKPYQANGGSYSSDFSTSSPVTNVAANCKVLDIPINVSYQFYSKGRNAFALGTGVSSYIMLRENYRFDYANGMQPYNIQIDNKNQHILGVLNVNATYERRINSKFSTVIQPYLKLPLTGIGQGRVDLKSTGVAVGINWNIGSALKPR
jgi:hypothetical protein